MAMNRKKKQSKPEIKEVLIPMTEEQFQESVDKLTQIYALVLGWERKSDKKAINVKLHS